MSHHLCPCLVSLDLIVKRSLWILAAECPFYERQNRYHLKIKETLVMSGKENQLLTEKEKLVTILTYTYDQHKRRRRRRIMQAYAEIYYILGFQVSEAVYVHKENVSIQSVHHLFTYCENLKLSPYLHHITLSCIFSLWRANTSQSSEGSKH